jgi:8-amino-7-oxononanoate synthase
MAIQNTLESVYSMDSDICPLEELVEIARELSPHNNVVFA